MMSSVKTNLPKKNENVHAKGIVYIINSSCSKCMGFFMYVVKFEIITRDINRNIIGWSSKIKSRQPEKRKINK